MDEYKIQKDMYSRTRLNYGNNMNKRSSFQVKNSFTMFNQIENETKSTKKNVNIPKRLTKNECRRYQEKVSKLNYDKIKPNLPIKMKWTTPKHKQYIYKSNNIAPITRYNHNKNENEYNYNNDLIWCLEKDKSWADEMDDYVDEQDDYVDEMDDYVDEMDDYVDEMDDYVDEQDDLY